LAKQRCKDTSVDSFFGRFLFEQKVPQGLHLEAKVSGGSCQRFRLTVMPCDYEPYWERTWYEKLGAASRMGTPAPTLRASLSATGKGRS